MADEPRDLCSGVPADLEGALELVRAAGDTIAVEVYEEVKAGKIELGIARDVILSREIEAELAR